MKLLETLRASGKKPRFHGNGFTQLYLSEHARLHVWVPALPVVPENNALVHDHIWSMHSTVLAGRLVNTAYDVNVNGDDEDRDMYRVNQEALRNGAPGPILELAYRGVSVSLIGSQAMAPGSRYFVPAGQFHASRAEGITVSLMTKTGDILSKPRVLCPVGEKPFDAFDQQFQPHENVLWMAIHMGLLHVSPYGLDLIEKNTG